MRLWMLNFSVFFFSFQFDFSHETIDVNFFEFQYLADHLTGKECNRLVASLHFRTFNLPKDLDAAERRIPGDVPCIDLLTHWNSSPKEGRGETHAAICHRLNQIGREDLAKWLSKTVSHEISKDLADALTDEKHTDTATAIEYNATEAPEPAVGLDETTWWEMDSLIEILLVICTIMIVCGSFFLGYLCCRKNAKPLYQKVNTRETS